MEEEWKLKADWDLPITKRGVVAYLLYRKLLNVDRGGYCSIAQVDGQEDCDLEGGYWVSSCEELSNEGDFVAKIPDLSQTEYIDTVNSPGFWRYAVYSLHESGAVTLCATNVVGIIGTFRVNIISEHGEVRGIFNVSSGETAEIEMVEVDHGFEFTGWSSPDYDITNPTNLVQFFVLTKSITVTANFSRKQYNLTVRAIEGEVVNNSGLYDFDSIVDIEAIGGFGRTFLGWSGPGIASRNSLQTTVNVKNDIEVVANFEAERFNLTLVSDGNGMVIGGGSFKFNEVTAIGAMGDLIFNPDGSFIMYNFDRWEVDEPDNIEIQDLTVANQNITVKGNVTLTGFFKE